MTDMKTKPVVVGITGASGSVMARATVDALLRRDIPTVALCSNAARVVWQEEMDENFNDTLIEWQEHPAFVHYPINDLRAPVASGTYPTAGMVIVPAGAESWMPVLITLGTVNVLYGAVSAMSQTDLKYIIGYSSVSHMGYVLMGIATLDRIGVAGAVLQMFSHGIMTALMFLLVGAIYDRTHTRDISVLKGLFSRMGVTGFFFAIAGLASMGLPGLSGFIAEFMVFTGAFRTYLPLAVLAVIGAALTAVYILRLLALTFLGELDARWEHLTDASPVEKAVGGAFVLIMIFVGVWPEPLLRLINVSVDALPGV